MRVWLLLAASLFSQAALADLFTAQLAYHKGDYERAFKDYRELAELGQPIAQYNLAILYENGEGVRQSDLNAYAWATLAAENGCAQAQGAGRQAASAACAGLGEHRRDRSPSRTAARCSMRR